MPISEVRRKLILDGFSVIERDDRLLDVFTVETAEKGVELWEKWGKEKIEIIRIHDEKLSHHVLDRHDIESALLHNSKLVL